MLSGLPFESYGRKNILEDLLPYMESDPELNIEDYRQNVLDAMKQDGKLYALPVHFTVPVLASKNGAFSQDTLTMTDFFDELFSPKPEEAPMRDTSALFNSLMLSSIAQFTDEAGSINLDAPEFIGFLENIKRADEMFKALPTADDAQDGISYFSMGGSSLEMPIYPDDREYVMNLGDIDSFSAAIGFKLQFNADFELRFPPSLRMPIAKGFSTGNIYGINRASENKEAAWQFLKFLISEEMQSSRFVSQGINGCPINLRASDKMIKTYLREADILLRQYAIQQHIEGVDVPSDDNLYTKIFTENQFTQADADKLEAMMSQVDTMLANDTTVLDLAQEELDPFLKGLKSAQDTARTLQSRLSMYLSEQQ
jgi:multiple sugar transport system substrate-binding protein